MPRTRKPAGTAVDPRNGRRVELAHVRLERFTLPKRSDGQAYDLRTRRMYAALWEDPMLSSVLALADRELVIRWAQSVDSWIKALARAYEDPISTGSMGQEVPSPWFSIAKQHLDVADDAERQIGIGALNRARLGISIAEFQKSLSDINAEFLEGDDDDEPDPRAIPGAVVG